jgi:hypothetical protein
MMHQLREVNPIMNPARNGRVTFILIPPDGKEILFGNTVTHKREMLGKPGRLIAAWTGEWKTDIFDLEPVRKELERELLRR